MDPACPTVVGKSVRSAVDPEDEDDRRFRRTNPIEECVGIKGPDHGCEVEVQLGGSVESFEPFEPNAAGGQDDPQGTLLRGVIEFGLLSSFGRSNEAVFEVSVADAPNITPPHLTAHEAEKRVPVGWPIYCFIVILFGLCFYSTAFALYFLLRRTPLS